MRILIIEDDTRLSDSLSQLLAKYRHSSDVAGDGELGLDMAMSGIYNLILLDIMLPKKNGMDVLRTIRTSGADTPVIILSAKSDPADKVAGLDAGADDYVTKPFVPEELMARIRAISRRSAKITPDHLLTFGDLTLNFATYELSCNDQVIRLGLKEIGITEMLLRGGKRIIPKEEMLVRVWGYDTDAEYNNVEVYISNLRKKFAQLGSSVTICTVRGVGYHLE